MLLFADYESYWADDYTLRKMSPAEYIMDPRFEASMMAFQFGEHGATKCVPGDKIQAFFDLLSVKPGAENIAMVTYNSLFDSCVTAWRYGFVPGLMIDVLGMVRAEYGMKYRRHSLGAMAENLDLPQGLKGNWTAKVKNMRLADIQRVPGLYQEGVDYAIQDVRLMVGIYRNIMPKFPLRELGIMDLVLRCAVQPQFKFDKPLLERHLKETVDRKAALLAACGLEYDEDGKCPDLMSAAKFSKLLEAQGIAVEMKTTQTGRQAPAVAKTDDFMAALLEHEDETVAALAAARLGHKSTLEETRTQRFITIASLPSANGYVGGSAPMPLRYGAAHTHRLGGDWSLNVQNLPRKSNLRKAIIPLQEDEEIISADESQIEARISAWFAGEKTLLQEFADNLDPYGRLGAAIFGLPTLPKKEFNTLYPVERFIGKTGILGLGYNAGWEKFWTMVHSSARTQLGRDVEFSPEKSQATVSIYRQRYHRLPAMWRRLQSEGLAALVGNIPECTIAPIVIKRGIIWGPNGQRMHYPDLKFDQEQQEWTYQAGNLRAKIYGGKILENITQWLARIVVMEAWLRLNALGLRAALQAHDELVFVVKKDRAPEAKKLIYTEMVRRPEWGEDIPLDAEVNSGPNYGEAK